MQYTVQCVAQNAKRQLNICISAFMQPHLNSGLPQITTGIDFRRQRVKCTWGIAYFNWGMFEKRGTFSAVAARVIACTLAVPGLYFDVWEWRKSCLVEGHVAFMFLWELLSSNVDMFAHLGKYISHTMLRIADGGVFALLGVGRVVETVCLR
jgi:hypothetical protein